MRAVQYRELAARIASVDVRNTLLKLALQHENIAASERARVSGRRPGGD
jgi:hypothetical protein